MTKFEQTPTGAYRVKAVSVKTGREFSIRVMIKGKTRKAALDNMLAALATDGLNLKV